MFQLRFYFGFICCFVFTACALPKNSPTEGSASASALPNAASGAQRSDTSVAQDFLRASQHCGQNVSLAADYRSQVNAFQYADLPVVHRYLHCVWSRMDLWNDRDGFQVDRIAELYRPRVDAELLVPTLVNCNRNERRVPPAHWCYLATKCILDSPVGQWFKDDVARVKTVPNGH